MHAEVFSTACRKEVSCKETHLIQVKNNTAKFLGKRTRIWREKNSSKKVYFYVDVMGFLNSCVSLFMIREAE